MVWQCEGLVLVALISSQSAQTKFKELAALIEMGELGVEMEMKMEMGV